MNDAQKKKKQNLKGKVVSDSMDKTVVVESTRFVRHPKYRKYYRKTKKYHAHDEANQYKKGDRVIIESSRPVSKTKSWIVKEKIS